MTPPMCRLAFCARSANIIVSAINMSISLYYFSHIFHKHLLIADRSLSGFDAIIRTLHLNTLVER